ncbi:MAG: glycoside hydrolase family 9 protein [Paludibacteraceae bacterium]|nr:glycoside hydrolase family 9 protein [Paludibacteraceae bacterium]
MKNYSVFAAALFAVVLICGCSTKMNTPLTYDLIKVNQVGYYPQSEKVAVLEEGVEADQIQLLDAKGKVVWTGMVSRQAVSPWSGKTRRIVDFSDFQQLGTYTLVAGNAAQVVTIAEHALGDVAKAAMESFYLQRTGVAIEEQYAGIYARPAAHFDTCILVHPSAATISRPAGTIISSPYGWYDAGDYNKYIVNSGFAVGQMLLGYELASEYYDAQSLRIPENQNDVPDFLDEIYFNLRWMVTMQDEDGGLYHKLTEPHFEGFIRPVDCQQQRYVVKKTTAASLDFAATMAMASRLYAAYPEYAAFADDALKRAIHAFEWAEANPNIEYDQNALNAQYEPHITTGAYDDKHFEDEFFWAATELFFATGDIRYEDIARQYVPAEFALPTWGEVSGLAMYEWIIKGVHPAANGGAKIAELPFAKEQLVKMLAHLDERIAEVPTSCYNAPYGNREADFGWGCNGEFLAGQGVAYLVAYRATENDAYLHAAMQDADYLLGRNATGYCYVTGFGQKQVMNPHQRLSFSDDIEAPLPGFLAGGPNPKQQDLSEVKALGGYPSNFADESYLDLTPSYASNEIAINWNAYLVALLWGIEAAQ